MHWGSTDCSTEHPGQDKLTKSEEANRLSEEECKRLDDKTTAAGREHGIDKVFREHNVDVIIGPADSYVPDVLALASKGALAMKNPCNILRLMKFTGYSSLTLPLGYLDWNGRPFGLIVVASAYQENLLLDVARAWEATFPPRRVPPLLDGK